MPPETLQGITIPQVYHDAADARHTTDAGHTSAGTRNTSQLQHTEIKSTQPPTTGGTCQSGLADNAICTASMMAITQTRSQKRGMRGPPKCTSTGASKAPSDCANKPGTAELEWTHPLRGDPDHRAIPTSRGMRYPTPTRCLVRRYCHRGTSTAASASDSPDTRAASVSTATSRMKAMAAESFLPFDPGSAARYAPPAQFPNTVEATQNAMTAPRQAPYTSAGLAQLGAVILLNMESARMKSTDTAISSSTPNTRPDSCNCSSLGAAGSAAIVATSAAHTVATATLTPPVAKKYR
mmetsp:Transcript_69031/g.183951  ORF Transcript_69031/g.183951 Transcript_69031/m.183951 type:complete len:295 (-) Transcript_69031:235-1119(-)